jgi:hypothetical protein
MKAIILALIALTLSGCATTYKVRTAQLFSPESEGEKSGSFLVGYHSAQEVTLTTNSSSILVENSRHPTLEVGSLGGEVAYGLMDKLDFGAAFDFDTPILYFLKYQLIGASRKQSETGNFSFSVLGGVAFEFSGTDEGSHEVLTTQSGTLKKNSGTTFQANPLFGYRINPSAILILGGTYWIRTISGSQTLINPSANGTYSDTPRYYDAHLGIKFNTIEENGKNAFLQLMVYRGFLQNFSFWSPITGTSIDVGFGF